MKVCLSCAARFASADWVCPSCGASPAVDDGLPVFAPALAAGGGEDADYPLSALFDAETRHFWFSARTRLVAWALRKYFPQCRSLLDVGCGTGGMLAGLRPSINGVRAEAADALTSALMYARRRLPGIPLAQMDIGHLPYDREFDVVGAFDVIEHLDDDVGALREMHRTCTVGGGVIVTVPQHRFLWSHVDEHSRHRRRYARRELVGKLQHAGFVVERATSFVTLLIPALVLARWIRRDATEKDPASELQIGNGANTVGRYASQVESLAIRAGLSLPLGGSLLAVARRTS